MSFFYRIDSINRSLPVLCWGCRSLPINGECHSREEMYEQIKQRLKEYYRNRPLPVQTCDECGLTDPKMESQDTCPDCLGDPYSYK